VITGLWIAGLGMAIIFAVLVVLLGIMVLLNRLLKPKAEVKDKR
jgi:Na+-transporting methylmalonyl-CoA/oxaloacetate decarboxylase gamma subunit